MAQTAVDQPTVTRFPPLGQQPALATRRLEQSGAAIAVDEDQLTRVAPHRRAMLEVGAGLAGNHTITFTADADQVHRSRGPRLGITSLAPGQAQVGDAFATGSDMRAAMLPIPLVRRQLPRRRAVELAQPDAPGAGSVRLPDHEALAGRLCRRTRRGARFFQRLG